MAAGQDQFLLPVAERGKVMLPSNPADVMLYESEHRSGQEREAIEDRKLWVLAHPVAAEKTEREKAERTASAGRTQRLRRRSVQARRKP
jgi:hypothetical protein